MVFHPTYTLEIKIDYSNLYPSQNEEAIIIDKGSIDKVIIGFHAYGSLKNTRLIPLKGPGLYTGTYATLFLKRDKVIISTPDPTLTELNSRVNSFPSSLELSLQGISQAEYYLSGNIKSKQRPRLKIKMNEKII